MSSIDLRKKLKKSIRLKLLIILGTLLVVNTFAWLIYTNTIGTTITASIKAWKITFSSNNEVVEYVEFDINELYPGMPDYDNYIKIINYGEIEADVSYELEEVTILGTTYTDEDYTSLELLGILNANPFQVTFSFDKTTVGIAEDFAEFNVNITWPYENDNDVADTQWGYDAYNFNQDYPGDPHLTIILKLIANQSQ